MWVWTGNDFSVQLVLGSCLLLPIHTLIGLTDISHPSFSAAHLISRRTCNYRPYFVRLEYMSAEECNGS